LSKPPQETKVNVGSPPLDRLWELFTSIRLAVFTLIALAVASILGTLVEQNQPPEKYHQIYEDWAFALMDRVNLFDMYHSWWFLALLVIFTVNLACCTIDRFPKVLSVVRNPRTKLDDGLVGTLPLVERWNVKGNPADAESRYAGALASLFAKPLVTREGEEVHMYAEAGTASRFGVYVTHLSIIVIFLGAIVGNVAGFKGFVNIPEGESVSRVAVRGGSRMQDFGFTLRCNSFTVETYPTGQPKAYVSDVSVIEGGREVLRRKDVVVNSPLRHKGIWFYQASYGEAGGAVVRIEARRGDGSAPEILVLPPDQPVPFSGNGFLRAVDFSENFEGKGPALRMILERNGTAPTTFWLPEGKPVAVGDRGNSTQLQFAGLAPRMFTGLQVAKDPGVNIVWVGCALMVAGILMAFFLSHRRVWLRLSRRTDGRLEAVLAGASNRNRLAFEKAFEKIRTGVKEAGK
jgi:cytochrome c biogenesis protein